MIEDIFIDLAELAERSLLYEVMASPKPGLVDRYNSGAHSDMDVYTFVNSAVALREYFKSFSQSGYDYDGYDYPEILKSIRQKGIEAEESMYKATGGVNTHKGIIFSMGILTSAVGSLLREGIAPNYDTITTRSKEIAKGVTSELKVDKTETYGEKFYEEHGSGGIRAEVESGFASIEEAYKIFSSDVSKHSIDEVLGQTLLHLMTTVVDSNVYGRCGVEGISHVKESAAKAIELGGYYTAKGLEYVYAMDEDFIERNLSPGGCADLLAVIYFIHSVETWYDETASRLVEGILNSKEERGEHQMELIDKYNLPLISFTLNIPGLFKNSNIYSEIHKIGIEMIRSEFGEKIKFEEIRELESGNEYYAVVDLPAMEIKKLTYTIEESNPIGRIFDMDIIDLDYGGVSRTELGMDRRKCLVCDNYAHECARSRAHSLKEVSTAMKSVITEAKSKMKNKS